MRAAAVVYLLAALIFTWPLAAHPSARLAAPVGPGDPFLNLWILGWGMQSVLQAPLSLLNGRAFNANIFHPAEGTLAYSDHLLLQSVLLAPLYALTGDVVVCYNVLLFASLVASAIAMHAFVLAVVGSPGAAYLAGLAWGFWPYRFAHLLHIQLQSLYFLPLAFLLLHRVFAGRRRHDAVGLGAAAGLQAVSSVYYGIVGAIGLVTGAIALAIGVGRWRSSLIARRLVLAGAVGVLVVAPVVIPYWRVQRAEGFGRNLFEASRNAATPASYVQTPPGNVLYGRTGLLTADAPRKGELPTGGPEREMFPGVVILLLAGVGIVLGLRADSRPLVLAMAAVGLLGFVLSLGPDGVRPVYAAFHRVVFGFQAVRAPARFGVLVMFALTTLAALGWRELSRHAHGRRRAAGSALLAALIGVSALESLNVPLPTVPAPDRSTPAGQWLAAQPGPGAVVYLPLGLDIESTPAMVESLQHRRPLVNGYSGQRPAFYTAVAETLAGFPSPEALVTLRELDVRFAVLPEPVAPPDPAAPWPLVERAAFPGAVVYELQWTPEIEQALDAVGEPAAPPAPGPIPFAPGEVARYAVLWSGAAMNVPAGTITMAVEEPAYTFRVEARTADWVARFFEAHDVFVTRAGEDLLPDVHSRELREGARHVIRTFVYDHAGGIVRLGRDEAEARGAAALALPLPASARDAISALYYVRTLPLTEGARYSIPVNEAGRNLVVDLMVEGRETITMQGRSVEATRIRPQIRRRLERRRPLQATLWVSDDARRLPLALDLDAGFGHVRVELMTPPAAPSGR